MKRIRSFSRFLIAGGVLAALAVFMAVGLPALTVKGADHLDAPGLSSPGADGRLDITDVYAFQSPSNPDNVVFIMGVNPAAGLLSPLTFHTKGKYQFLVDTNGDARAERAYQITFGNPDLATVQDVQIVARGLKAKGKTGETISLPNGGMLRAGVYDDPFFFDLIAFLGAGGRAFCDGKESNTFKGLNIGAIILEIPRSELKVDKIGVWARTELGGKQIDRMGRPAINAVFIPNNPFEPVGTERSQKDAFNANNPSADRGRFGPEIIDSLKALGNSDETAKALADVLLPDILTIDTSSAEGFLNGRKLADDVIDAELNLITGGALTGDCVANDSTFSNTFPYLGAAN